LEEKGLGLAVTTRAEVERRRGGRESAAETGVLPRQRAAAWEEDGAGRNHEGGGGGVPAFGSWSMERDKNGARLELRDRDVRVGPIFALIFPFF
jgi:hypothetical protein